MNEDRIRGVVRDILDSHTHKRLTPKLVKEISMEIIDALGIRKSSKKRQRRPAFIAVNDGYETKVVEAQPTKIGETPQQSHKEIIIAHPEADVE